MENVQIIVVKCFWGSNQWNKLLETCCMKYEIFVRCNKSVYFNDTAHTVKQETYMFLEIYFMKLINCVVWGNIAQLQTLLSSFLLIQMERLQQIVWNIFPYVHWAANMLQAVYLWNVFHAICFIDVRRAFLWLEKYWLKTLRPNHFICCKAPFLQAGYTHYST